MVHGCMDGLQPDDVEKVKAEPVGDGDAIQVVLYL